MPQHNLVVADFRFWIRTHMDKQAKIARMKWGNSKGRHPKFLERVFVEGAWFEEENAYNMRMKMATCIRKVAS